VEDYGQGLHPLHALHQQMPPPQVRLGPMRLALRKEKSDADGYLLHARRST
jgi:hypothetical protein